MLHHILFCLDEIEAEVASTALTQGTRTCLDSHVKAMRLLVAATLGPQVPDADDLFLIRGIDAITEAHLKSRGIRTFAEIAAWTASDIAAMTSELIAPRQISSEGWIEQAAILATGATTAHARRLSRRDRPVASDPVVATPQGIAARTEIVLAPITETVNTPRRPAPPPLPPYQPPVLDGSGAAVRPGHWIIADTAEPAATPLPRPAATLPADGESEDALDIPERLAPKAYTIERARVAPADMHIAALALRAEGTAAGWARRAALSAMLLLLAGAGLGGIEAKRSAGPAIPLLSQIVSAD